VKTLSPLAPYLRGAPAGLPFVFDEKTMQQGLNFTLTTSIGDIDLLGEVVGSGTYETLISNAIKLNIFGNACFCVDLESLIKLKRAAGRPKDLEVIAELETLKRKK